jgi:hypothetical protein
MAKEGSRPAARRKWRATDARIALEEWKRSGETEFAFARGRGFSPQRLRYRRSRLGVPAEQGTAPPGFVAVSMPVVGRATLQIEIHVCGLSVCVGVDVVVEHLARIVGALARVRTC